MISGVCSARIVSSRILSRISIYRLKLGSFLIADNALIVSSWSSSWFVFKAISSYLCANRAWHTAYLFLLPLFSFCLPPLILPCPILCFSTSWLSWREHKPRLFRKTSCLMRCATSAWSIAWETSVTFSKPSVTVSSARFFIGRCQHLGLARRPLSRAPALWSRFYSVEQSFAHRWLRVIASLVYAGLGLFLFGRHYFFFFLRLLRATKSDFVILLRGFAAPAIFFCLDVSFFISNSMRACSNSWLLVLNFYLLYLPISRNNFSCEQDYFS